MRPFEDNCGIFGKCSHEDCIRDLSYGAFNLQHRGQKYCDISTPNKKKNKLMVRGGLVKHSLMFDDLRRLEGKLGIDHVSLRGSQPIMLDSKLGKSAIAVSRNIINSADYHNDWQN